MILHILFVNTHTHVHTIYIYIYICKEQLTPQNLPQLPNRAVSFKPEPTELMTETDDNTGSLWRLTTSTSNAPMLHYLIYLCHVLTPIFIHLLLSFFTWTVGLRLHHGSGERERCWHRVGARAASEQPNRDVVASKDWAWPVRALAMILVK